MKKKTITVTALCLLMSARAFAEQWYFEPTASLLSGYEDNVRLSTSNEQDDYNALLNLDMRFGARTEVSDIKFQVQLDSERYADLDDLNNDGWKFGVDTRYRHGLNQFGLKVNYDRDSTRNTEESSTGNVGISNHRVLKSIAPTWQRQVTERSVLFANYNYSDVSYEGGTQIDYWNDSVSVGVTHNLTEKTMLQVSLGVSRFEADSLASNEYESNSLQIGLNHQFSSTLSGDFSVGFTQTDSEFRLGATKIAVSNDSWQLNAALQKQFVSTSIKAGIVVSEQPSSNGRLLQTTALNLNVDHKLTERINLSLDAKVYANETSGGITIASDEREYFSIQPMLQWRATEWWTVTADYRYRQQEYTNTIDGAAESNAAFITLRYVLPR